MLTTADLPSFALDGETYVRPDFAGRGLANVAPTLLRLLAPSAAPLDLPSLGISVLVLGVAAAVACLLAALKAVRIKPTEALRE